MKKRAVFVGTVLLFVVTCLVVVVARGAYASGRAWGRAETLEVLCDRWHKALEWAEHRTTYAPPALRAGAATYSERLRNGDTAPAVNFIRDMVCVTSKFHTSEPREAPPRPR